jgi:hypothetical protein
MFLGIRAFARILKINTRWASLPWVLGITAVAVPLVAVLPHGRSDFSSTQIAASNALTAIDVVFLWFTAATVLRIRRLIGPLYINAMSWLYAALGVNILAALHYMVVNLLVPRDSNWYFHDSMATPPFLLGAILLVRAGYAMAAINLRPAVETTPALASPNNKETLPLINIITYLAGLASKPEEIDPTLDVLRQVTSTKAPDQPLSPDDEKKLIEVYGKIETYLTSSDPLQAYTTDGLRSRISQEFKLTDAAAGKLWGSPANASSLPS